MAMSESFTKTTERIRHPSIGAGDSNRPRYYKCLECLELGGVMSGYDDSTALQNRWHRKCNCLDRLVSQLEERELKASRTK